MIVLLDAGPLGILTNPKAKPLNLECRQWMKELLLKNYRVILPEIADYEVRRELIRANRLQGIQRLNEWKSRLEYQPLTTATMLKAAEFWAEARQTGKPTASPEALDGDVILAAQASLIADSQGDRIVVVATTNVGHLERFVNAKYWQAIS
jgi:predicted nucleic acid-binding protein